jgi:serine/threonine-protein kinase RIO1
MISNIMGIDVEIGFPNKPTYAVYCENSGTSENKIHTGISSSGLKSLIEQFNPQIIASDNINEVLVSDIMIDYFCNLQDKVDVIQVTASNPSQMTSVLHEARRAGIPLKNKPWPVQTAIICTILAAKQIGSKVYLVKNGGKLNIKYEALKPMNVGKASRAMLEIDPSKEMTERESFKLLSEHPFVDEIIGIVAAGKEANVFLVIDRNGDNLIIKSFKTYTSVADAIRSSTYKIKAHQAPIILAKQEARNLKRFEKLRISVPKISFRDGTLVGMEAITYDNGSLVQPLSNIESKLTKDQIEGVLEQVLDNLYNIFNNCKMVHGDFSANNLLYDGNKIYVIDVSQAEFVNFNTFIDTPKRIRFDRALEVLIRDLNGILTFFENNFRVKLERELITSQFIDAIPKYFVDKVDYVLSRYR